jgi:hypothetical protein
MNEDDVGDAAIGRILRVARSGVANGRDRTAPERAYYRRCTHFHWRTGTVVMFPRDMGHHSSGWMKNPDFERCLHLSLSFREPYPLLLPDMLGDPRTITALGGTLPPVPFDARLAEVWVRLVLGDARRLSWEEGPFSADGKAIGVRHWRVFTDPAWVPIKPRGEVYDRTFTELGWKSWSERQGEQKNWVDAE